MVIIIRTIAAIVISYAFLAIYKSKKIWYNTVLQIKDILW
jgi:hypothetical protein